MQHLGTKILNTERLLLRPFRGDDAEAMYRNWAADPEVTRYLTWQPHASPSITRKLCELWAAESEKPQVYQWALVLKGLDEPIGSLSVVQQNEALSTAELGYCIGRAWWGRELMPEALGAVLSFLLREVGFRRVQARHDVRNLKSGRVMQKAGMRREGILRAAGRNSLGETCDMAVYAVLAEDFEAQSCRVFRPLARSKQALTQEDCLRILQEEKRGVLSVIGDQGYPYGLPHNHWYDPRSGKLCFHSGAKGHKIDAIRMDARASYCVSQQADLSEDGWSYYFNSVIVFGRLEIVADHEEALEISRRLSYAFTGDREYIEEEVAQSGHRVLCFTLTPEHISGKRVHEK